MPTSHVLIPKGGSKHYPAPRYKGEIDTLVNRWNRHFHNLYGYSHGKTRLHFLSSPVDKLYVTPYITTSNLICTYGFVRDVNTSSHLGALDYLNILQPLSILLIAAQKAMSKKANSLLGYADEDHHSYTVCISDQEEKNNTYRKPAALEYIGGALLKAAAFLLDFVVRFPIGFFAMLTTHTFDAFKALAACAIATVSALVVQAGAEIAHSAGLVGARYISV